MISGAKKRLAEAKAAISGGRLREAERQLREVLASEPRDVESMMLLAFIAANSGRQSQAVQLLENVLQVDPNSYGALTRLCGFRRTQGDVREALSLAQRAAKVAPSEPNSQAALAMCYLDAGELDKAKDAFDQALRLSPSALPLILNRARTLIQMGRLEEAEADYLEAIRTNPKSVEALVRLGELRVEVGNRLGAIECFKSAYGVEPDSERGRVHLVKALLEENLVDDAERFARETLHLFPDSMQARIFYGTVLKSLGRFGEAKQIFMTALENDPGNPELYFNIAYCGRVTTEDQAFLSAMHAALQRPGLSPRNRSDLSYALGKSYDDLGDFEQAFRHFDEANRAMIQRLPNGPVDRRAVRAEVDLTIKTFTKEFFRSCVPLASSSELPVLIVGMIRSGTSLLEQILSSHPEVRGAGELHFWMKNGLGAVSLGSSQIDPARSKELIDRYESLVNGLSEGARRVTDKMPLNFMRAGVIHALFPNARILHCRRNPKDTCLSIYMTPYHLPVEFAHDKANIVFYYEQYLRLMEHWREVLPSDRFIEVDYEELIADRERVTRRLIAFCGLDWSDSCLGHQENTRVVVTPSLWQVRQPIYRSSIDRWRGYEPWLGPFANLG